MARRSRTLTSLEGKLGEFRRDALKFRRNALKVLRNLKEEIGRRARELTTLKQEYAKAAKLLPEQVSVEAGPFRRRPKRRARQVNWKQVLTSLPARFTLKTLESHPVAGKKPKPHLYAILSRWKKEGMLTADQAGGYKKVEAKPKRTGARRPKPARTPKPAPRPEAPAA
jgi:hypothetical protein